jgi:hypothetical protein
MANHSPPLCPAAARSRSAISISRRRMSAADLSNSSVRCLLSTKRISTAPRPTSAPFGAQVAVDSCASDNYPRLKQLWNNSAKYLKRLPHGVLTRIAKFHANFCIQN